MMTLMITTTETRGSIVPVQLNTRYIWLISVVAALGGLLFGYDWVVVGGAKPFFERYFHLTDPDGHALSFARPLRT